MLTSIGFKMQVGAQIFVTTSYRPSNLATVFLRFRNKVKS